MLQRPIYLQCGTMDTLIKGWNSTWHQAFNYFIKVRPEEGPVRLWRGKGVHLETWLTEQGRNCKLGYFRWGKISRQCWQDLSRWGNFHDCAPISIIKSYGFNFRAGEIFAEKEISRKTRKLPHAKIPTIKVPIHTRAMQIVTTSCETKFVSDLDLSPLTLKTSEF